MAKQVIDPPMKHLFDGGDLNVYDRNVVNLSAGSPGPDLLRHCCELFQTATEHRMKVERSNEAYLFQYGPTVGGFEFRETLAKFLSKGYESQVLRESLVLTAGASHGLHLILSTLINMDSTIFVDEFTYMIALQTFALFPSMTVVSVPLTKEGVNIEMLEQLARKYNKKDLQKGKLFSTLYYTIPTYHNPTGILFSDAVCKELIHLSRKYDFLIACDDVYNLLYYTDQIPKRLFAYDDRSDSDYKGTVISNCSFSKTLSPGIRLGWMECPPECFLAFRSCGVLQSGGAANHYSSGIVNSLIELGLAEQQLNLYRRKYKERMLAACELLRSHLPTCCSFFQPSGGYFIWIELPESVDAEKANLYALEHCKVLAIIAKRFSPNGYNKSFLRVSFGFHEVDTLKEGLKRLCDSLKFSCK